jgi:hypothetical protein
MTSIVRSAALIESSSFDCVRGEIVADPISTLRKFPFVGEVTAFHLAKNFGFDFPKPDRNLQRLSSRHGYSDVQGFCRALAKASGESVRNVDTLLWRISEMGLGSELRFASIARPADVP